MGRSSMSLLLNPSRTGTRFLQDHGGKTNFLSPRLYERMEDRGQDVLTGQEHDGSSRRRDYRRNTRSLFGIQLACESSTWKVLGKVKRQILFLLIWTLTRHYGDMVSWMTLKSSERARNSLRLLHACHPPLLYRRLDCRLYSHQSKPLKVLTLLLQSASAAGSQHGHWDRLPNLVQQAKFPWQRVLDSSRWMVMHGCRYPSQT